MMIKNGSKFKVQGCERKTGNFIKKFLTINIARGTSNFEQFSRGFTSIELIVVIIALSILAGAAVVSFRVSDQDKSTIAADQLIADIQYVQIRAMGIGNSQSISFTNGNSAYRILDNASVPIENKNLPDAVTVISNNFNNTLKFNSLGEPFYDSNSNCTGTTTGLAGNCSITLRDNVTVMIYAITGKTCLYDTANNRCF
jgi:prepilin-type N-terminal cleavage/methylation domain-containing protein